MTAQFTDRTTYLAWAAQWKADYRQASAALRQLKHEFKAAQRAGLLKVNSLRTDIAQAKRKANEMIHQRHESKVEAQRQYLAERSAKQAA